MDDELPSLRAEVEVWHLDHCARVQRTVARFNPIGPNDLAQFRAVLAGQHTITGFRNGDITTLLYPKPHPTSKTPTAAASASRASS